MQTEARALFVSTDNIEQPQIKVLCGYTNQSLHETIRENLINRHFIRAHQKKGGEIGASLLSVPTKTGSQIR